MSAFAYQKTELRLRPTLALLVSESEGRHWEMLLTTHAVHETDERFVIGAGRVLGMEERRLVLEILSKSAREFTTAFLPKEVVSYGSTQLAWCVPGKVRMMHFQVGSRRISINVPWPTLLLRARSHELSMVALSGRRRPTQRTPVYHAPLMNINCTGRMCAGNTKLPNGIELRERAGYEKALFDTYFTHASHNETLQLPKLTTVSNHHHMRFWRSLAEANTETFPSSALVPMGKTLDEWLGS